MACDDKELERIFQATEPKIPPLELAQQFLQEATHIMDAWAEMPAQHREYMQHMTELMLEGHKCAKRLGVLTERALYYRDELLFDILKKSEPIFSSNPQ